MCGVCDIPFRCRVSTHVRCNISISLPICFCVSGSNASLFVLSLTAASHFPFPAISKYSTRTRQKVIGVENHQAARAMLISRRTISTSPSTLHVLSLLLFSTRLIHSVRADDDDDDDDQPLLRDNSPNCTCYALESGTGGDNSQPYYFTYHRFWDFRALATQADQYTETPDPVTDDEDQGYEMVSSQDAGYLNGSVWNKDWGIQNWGKEATEDFPVRMQNSPRNVYICEHLHRFCLF